MKTNNQKQFGSLEKMCRDRAAVARKEMDYWLAEAEEWRKLRESANSSAEGTPIQLDWCESHSH
jgi:hypothetical protein